MEDAFWNEMNRREKWDRDHEKRMLALEEGESYRSDGDRDTSLVGAEKEKALEDQARLEWDAQNAMLPIV